MVMFQDDQKPISTNKMPYFGTLKYSLYFQEYVIIRMLFWDTILRKALNCFSLFHFFTLFTGFLSLPFAARLSTSYVISKMTRASTTTSSISPVYS